MSDCDHVTLYALDFANQPQRFDRGRCLLCERDALRADLARSRAAAVRVSALWEAEHATVMRLCQEWDEARAALPGQDDYVAWLCYAHHDNGATTVHLCDSDAPGAFRVYRLPAHVADIAQALGGKHGD